MNKDIDNIFSDKIENEIKNEVRRKRNKLNIKLIAIGTALTLIIIIVGNLVLNAVSNKYIESSYSKEREIKELEYTVMYPNSYIGQERCIGIGYFKYETNYEIGKRIGSKVLFDSTITNVTNVFDNKFEKVNTYSSSISNLPLNDDINKRYSNVNGLRKLHFLYPYVHYGKNIYEYQREDNKISENDSSISKETLINDFHYLDEIGDNKIVEMALSFDNEYNYEEVNKMLNSNLITFYWIDNNSEETKQQCIKYNNPAYTVVGIKSIDGAGEFRDDVNGRLENFKAALKQLKDLRHTQYTENIDENNIKIIGAVVVGTPKELKYIQNNPMIKHAVIGTVVEKY